MCERGAASTLMPPEKHQVSMKADGSRVAKLTGLGFGGEFATPHRRLTTAVSRDNQRVQSRLTKSKDAQFRVGSARKCGLGAPW
jgi:hypothetical protein